MLERNPQEQLTVQPVRSCSKEDGVQKQGRSLLCLLSQAPAGCCLDLGLPGLFLPMLTPWDSSQECVKTGAAESALTSGLQFVAEAVWFQFTPFARLLRRRQQAVCQMEVHSQHSPCVRTCATQKECSALGEESEWREVVGTAVSLRITKGLIQGGFWRCGL